MELLAGPAVNRGLIGPNEAFRLWDRHILNCAVVAPLIPSACSVLDVGSGAGLPGIVLALARPDLRVTLVEPMQRRTSFLEECVDALALEPTVTVVRARAEQLHGSLAAATVTARALAPLRRLVEWCWPLVGPGGQLMALKGATAAAELGAVEAMLPREASTSIRECGKGLVQVPSTVVLLQRGRRAPEER